MPPPTWLRARSELHKHNYARYGLFFCRSLTRLPSDVEQQFLRGEQFLHHTEGLWNSMPSDQFIETTWMKRGKGPSGIIGDTHNRQTVATWSYSQHAVVMRGYRFFLGSSDPPPLRLSAILFCLLICPGPCNNLDPLLKFLYEPPPPPLLNVRTPPSESWIRAWS